MVLWSFCPVLTVLASTTGKIAGMVVDGSSGEELVGATVCIQGSSLATATDSDGEFYIINVPVGEFTLVISMLGYKTTNVQDVRVLTDLTTPVDVKMMQISLQLDKSVTVYARRPLIQRDQTSSGAIVTRDDIVYLADASSVNGVISNMSGAVTAYDGLHVRGGRVGSLSYYFDGFPISDPFFGTIGIGIVPGVMEELSLTSGGLMPEYGEALSGVVNAITREGTDKYHGRVKVSDGWSHRYDMTTATFGDLHRTNTHTVAVDLSGPVAPFSRQSTTFFSAFQFDRDDGYLPHNRSKTYFGTGKVVSFPLSGLKVAVDGAYSLREEQSYVHRDNNNLSYDFNLDGLGRIRNEAYLYGVNADYNVSANTVYSLKASRCRIDYKRAPEHLFDLHYTQWPGYSEDENGVYNGTIQDSNYNASADYYYWGFTTGDDFLPRYDNRVSACSWANFSVLSQINKYNQVKLGGDLRHYELRWDTRQFFNVQPYGETYVAFPWIGAAYAQDKIELNDLVVNIGLRLDYMNTDKTYWNDPIKKDFRRQSTTKVQWSPRLGISHPISASSVLRFNYGYLFQPPLAYILYTNLRGETESGYSLFGNPDLGAEKTIYYELGLSQLLGEDVRLQLTTYYKDIRNLIGAREEVSGISNFTIFTNSDYGSVKGLDLILESVRLGPLNWSLDYSYMLARGNSSRPDEWYYYYFTIADLDQRPQIPTREYPLSYDQRHNLTAVVDFRVPRAQPIRFMGLSLPDAWGVNCLAHYGSGLAYTRTDKNGRRIGMLNGERMPYTLRVDARFNKDFYLSRQSGNCLSLFVEVVNLFDRRNILRVYTSTGRPDEDNRDVLNIGSATYEEELIYENLIEKDPQNYAPPRQIRVGLEFGF